MNVPFRGKVDYLHHVSFENTSFEVGTIQRGQWGCDFSECHRETSSTFFLKPFSLRHATSF